MNVTIHASAREFLAVAGDWLAEREVLNSLMLGIATRLAEADKPPKRAPVLMIASTDEGLAGAALMTPPRGAVLYAPGEDGPEAIDALAETLLKGNYSVPECIGPAATAEQFANIWSARIGQAVVRKMAQRIYELRRVQQPVGVPGSARLAVAEDEDIVARWLLEFSTTLGEPGDSESVRRAAQTRIANQQVLLWVHEGQPVSMAVAVRPAGDGIAIGSVYTPPEHRRNGFASACVAGLSQRQLDAGKAYCSLYTDLANPTSNSIYQKIGYVPVAESAHYRFVSPEEMTEE